MPTPTYIYLYTGYKYFLFSIFVIYYLGRRIDIESSRFCLNILDYISLERKVMA